MEINGNDVNNLFLGGNRFTNIADDYFLPVGTEFFGFSYSDIAVSYTHLTLPTICSV